MSSQIENLIKDLPDPASGRRFLEQLRERAPSSAARLLKNASLSSDVLTLVAFSPLLATTLLQNPDYMFWLERKRREQGVRTKEELLESLGRFSLTNSQLDAQVLFARFRRRELLRIYLRDIRRLATIAEITEEISVLADSILEAALQMARREMDNRFGQPQELDQNGRSVTARFCVIALGKLGSRELNYSSDIDLLFTYSAEGQTSGNGTKGVVTNREYFVKLAEYLSKLVGQPGGEGAAYRVDLRLRPHGSLGPLAVSLSDLVRYYSTEARPWERQVLIRSRVSCGDADIYRQFFSQVEKLVFSKEETPASALASVRRSKESIDKHNVSDAAFDIKLGSGGIREIEFIAQALQLAYGGNDSWLRAPHTLISLGRLKDRSLITERELTELSSAYEFLRRVEHILQMENGVQTHTIPNDPDRRRLLANRLRFAGGIDLDGSLKAHTRNVAKIFGRVLPKVEDDRDRADHTPEAPSEAVGASSRPETGRNSEDLEILRRVSPHFAALADGHPEAFRDAPGARTDNVSGLFADVWNGRFDFRTCLSSIRKAWHAEILRLAAEDAAGRIDAGGSKKRQTRLAEETLRIAIEIVRRELESKYAVSLQELKLAVLALGKLGGGSIDYDSDLDLIFVFDDSSEVPGGTSHVEFFGRAAELLVTTLSSMTREGSLYRVDLRLRPYGSKGLSCIGSEAFLDYIRERAAVWELLAFLKLRSVSGDSKTGNRVEQAARSAIHERAKATDPETLRSETLSIRDALEQQRSRGRRGVDIDIKYGEGGMLDVYFAVRYLQLLWDVRDEGADRSTVNMLRRLAELSSTGQDRFALQDLARGYDFLSRLDHALRLTVGRTTKLPLGNEHAMKIISERMSLSSPAELLEQLTAPRIAIRAAYETILKPDQTCP